MKYQSHCVRMHKVALQGRPLVKVLWPSGRYTSDYIACAELLVATSAKFLLRDMLKNMNSWKGDMYAELMEK